MIYLNNNYKFVNEKHEKNYINLIGQFIKKITKELDIALKLLSIEEVYEVAKEHIEGTKIKFNELLNDSRLTQTAVFISELAYSLLIKDFRVTSIQTTKKLDNDTRNFIIGVLDSYTINNRKSICKATV